MRHGRAAESGRSVRAAQVAVTYRFSVQLRSLSRPRQIVGLSVIVLSAGFIVSNVLDRPSSLVHEASPGSSVVRRPKVLATTDTRPNSEARSNRVGDLPEIARGPVPSSSVPASEVLTALPAWRLASPVSYASGAIKATPVPRSVQPIRRKGAITATATKIAAQQFGGTLRPADIDTFFAEFDAPVGEWLGKVGSIETEPRAVWFVVFTGMESRRSTGVVVRKRDQAGNSSTATSSTPTTTLSLDVTSDVVVVIDDDTGEVLVASEFLSEAVSRSTR